MTRGDKLKTLTLGYIDPMPAYILPCFVNKEPGCKHPGLKAEVWRTFAQIAGFKLDFKRSTHIGGDGTTDHPASQTFLFEFLANKSINASLAVSSMRPIRFAQFKYTTPVYFSQNGLVAGKMLDTRLKPIALQVFPWNIVFILILLFIIVAILQKRFWGNFGEYIGKWPRKRGLSNAFFLLFGAILSAAFNAGFRSQAAAVASRGTTISLKELSKGLNDGRFRLISRDYITAEWANIINLLGRPATQQEIDRIIEYEKDLKVVAEKLCRDDRLICYELIGGVMSLTGGRYKRVNIDCALEKIDVTDSSYLTPSFPGGFALSPDFPREYQNLLNKIIMRLFSGNQLDRASGQYDLVPWAQKKAVLPDSISMRVLAPAFWMFLGGLSLALIVAVIEKFFTKIINLGVKGFDVVKRVMKIVILTMRCWRHKYESTV